MGGAPGILGNPGTPSFTNNGTPGTPTPMGSGPGNPGIPTFTNNGTPGTPTLPANFGFNDLAGYEEARRNQFGNQAQSTINSYGADFEKRAADRRAALTSSLAELGQKQFSMANPFILEDLNSRGFSTSPTAMAQAQGDKLKEIALANQQQLLGLEGQDFNTAEDLRQTGLAASIQAQQDALDSGLDLRRGGLEASRADALAAQEQGLANSLADKQRRGNITNSLIGAGGSLLGGAMQGGRDSLLGSLFSKGAPAALSAGGSALGGSALGMGAFGGGGSALGASVSPALAGTSVSGGLTGAAGMPMGSTLGGGGSGLGGAGGAGVGAWGAGIGAGLLGGGYGGQVLGNSIFKSKKAEKRARTGASAGAGIGTAAGSIFGPAGSAVGGLLGGALGQGIGGLTASHVAGQISQQAKDLLSKPGKTIVNAPKNVAKTISKSISKAFCFDGSTPITMSDGSIKLIKDIHLGDETAGGAVESVRTSITGNDTRYNYKGTIVTGSHAVLENGYWTRVEDSVFGFPIPGEGVVYSLATSHHRVIVGETIFADELETDDYENLTIAESLNRLNGTCAEVR